MQAVLFVGHGSRIKAGVEEAIRFIERCSDRIDTPIQEICFLELAAPSIVEGIAKCVERGATKIAVVPILLLTANHANEDIPFEIEIGRIMYPDVEFTYGKALGIHPKIVDSLYDRIIEQQVPIAEDARVLLIGRGSSDPAVKRDLTEIATMLQETYSFSNVSVSFLYGATPILEDALAQLKAEAHRQVFIIPYLLFTGILMKNIEKKVEQKSSDDQQLILCESLGYHSAAEDVLVQRVNELLVPENRKQEVI